MKCVRALLLTDLCIFRCEPINTAVKSTHFVRKLSKLSQHARKFKKKYSVKINDFKALPTPMIVIWTTSSREF